MGRATIGEKLVIHQAVAAEDMMQAFLYRHLVPANELLVTVARNVPAVASKPTTRPATRPLTTAKAAAATKPAIRVE